INGAGAEATHIWDSKTTLREAYATLMEQYRLLFEIGAQNRARGYEPMTFKAMMNEHRSIREYDDRPVSDDTLRQILESAQHAASSSFIQATAIVRVANADTRADISEVAGGQRWVREAPIFLVWCADMTRIEAASLKADAGELDGWTEHFIAATVDVALVAQNALLAAESLGLGGVYIGGIRNNPARVCELLELPRLVYPVFGMCLGYPAQDPGIKPRMPLDAMLHQERFDASRATQIVDAYDAQMADYYASRGSNVRQSNWSAQTTNAVQGKRREHMLGFLQEQGYLKK
ncbi:unnamed protein product, partial [Cyprideis torosa]